MRIFSSAENCRRVERQISLITCSAGSFAGPDFCPICAPSMATMGQKSSLPQPAISVSSALMPDTAVETAAEAQKPARRPLPEHLPREDRRHPAPCTCPGCGGALRKIADEVSETLDYVPGR